MRRTFLAVVLSLGVLVVWASILVWLRRERAVPAQSDSQASSGEVQLAEAQPSPEMSLQAPTESLPNPLLAIVVPQAKAPPIEDSTIDGRNDQHEALLAARIAELKSLSRKTDDASLATLLSEVKSPDEETRQAALDAISQSGRRAALPGLRELAAQTEDRQEKQAIEETIEFLSLPTLTEVLRGQTATNNYLPAR